MNVHCHIIFSNKCLFIGKANITKIIDHLCKEIRIFDVFLLEIKDPNSDTYVFQIKCWLRYVYVSSNLNLYCNYHIYSDIAISCSEYYNHQSDTEWWWVGNWLINSWDVKNIITKPLEIYFLYILKRSKPIKIRWSKGLSSQRDRWISFNWRIIEKSIN